MGADRLVSALISVRDGERYLAEAIESVLSQTHGALEVVVVDNGSRDGSREVMQRYAPEVRCLALPRGGGVATARNAAVAATRGAWVGLLDYDDLWEPDKVAVQLERLEAPDRPEVVFGGVRDFVSPDMPPDVAERIQCDNQIRPGTTPGAMLVRREAFERFGLFPERWWYHSPMAWLLAARESGLREASVPHGVLRRRLHDHNLSWDDEARREYALIIAEALARRRAVGR
jgi:glycosyltransferase involved in cell wall biosynthesis